MAQKEHRREARTGDSGWQRSYIFRSLSCLLFLPPQILTQTQQTAKIGSLVDIQDSEDPEGLRVFYYLVQDLKVRIPHLSLGSWLILPFGSA